MDVKELKVGEVFPINEELAGIVPMAIKSEQVALAQNIADNGLRDPVVLYKGRVVDGRCRQLACTISGVAIRARELDDNLTEEEVKIFVKSVNTRRNLTVAQKIIVASKESCRPGSKSLNDIASSWGISRSILIRANYVARNRPNFIEPLFNGLTVPITDTKGNRVQTNKISAIHAHIKREDEGAEATASYEWDANSVINTQKGKDWFYEFIKSTNTTNVLVLMELANRANDKFKASAKVLD